MAISSQLILTKIVWSDDYENDQGRQIYMMFYGKVVSELIYDLKASFATFSILLHSNFVCASLLTFTCLMLVNHFQSAGLKEWALGKRLKEGHESMK